MNMTTSPATCTRCQRRLTSPTSIARGMGRGCAARVREVAAAATDLVKPDTLAKAIEDIEDGALIDTRRITSTGRRVFAVVSSDGTRTYLATSEHCACHAGLKGRACRHRLAVAILAA